MDSYKELELYLMIIEKNSVTITVVGYNDTTFDETFVDFDEAKAAIEHYEQMAEVYF